MTKRREKRQLSETHFANSLMDELLSKPRYTTQSLPMSISLSPHYISLRSVFTLSSISFSSLHAYFHQISLCIIFGSFLNFIIETVLHDLNKSP